MSYNWRMYRMTSNKEVQEIRDLVEHISKKGLVDSSEYFIDKVISQYDNFKSKNRNKFDEYSLNLAIEALIFSNFGIACYDIYLEDFFLDFQEKVFSSLTSAPRFTLRYFRYILYGIIALATIGFGTYCFSKDTSYLSYLGAAILFILRIFRIVMIDRKKNLVFFQKLVDYETKRAFPVFIICLFVFGLAGYVLSPF